MVKLIELGPSDACILARFLREKGDQVALSPDTQSATLALADLQRLVANYGVAFTDQLCLTP